MRIFGFTIGREKASDLAPVDNRGGWSSILREPFAGAWQQSDADFSRQDAVLSNNAVWACVTLIASDIAKLRPRLVELSPRGIWTETSSASFSPVLRKPNRYQTHIQFKESWVISKALRGNAYALLERDARGVVVAMYLLNPDRVVPLVTPDGAVYYQLSQDNLSGVADVVTVPASEIAHDRFNCMFHPLVGLSPLYASGATAKQGLQIQRNSSQFFGNNSSPGGVLTAPGSISDDLAGRLKSHWDSAYTGANAGRVAVLGDGLKFEPMRMTAVESQMVEQQNVSAKVICSAFHVPPFMVGLGDEPTFSNGETRTLHYYSQCLQGYIESMEECFDWALGLAGGATGGRVLGVDLDLAGLQRMDTVSQMTALESGVRAGIMAPNEARQRLNLPPADGGDTPYMQQQQWSLEQLNKRPPPDTAPAPAPIAPPAVVDGAAKAIEPMADAMQIEFSKHMRLAEAKLDRLQSAVDGMNVEPDESVDSKAIAEALMRKFTAGHAKS